MPTWMKVETRVRTHPKIAKTVKETGHADAAWLWHAGNLYCKDALTDGFIADEMLAGLVTNLPPRVLKDLPAVLVKHGLWHREEGGWRVHDWLKYNHSKAVVEEKRAADRERKRDGFQSESERTTRASAPATSPSASGPGSSEGVPGEPPAAVAVVVEATPPAHATRRRGYADPHGMRPDPNAVAMVVWGPVESPNHFSLSSGWFEKVRGLHGLSYDDADAFAKWLGPIVTREGGVRDGGKFLAYLDAKLAQFLVSRRVDDESAADVRRADAFIAEQAAHRATAAPAAAVLEGLRAGRASR